MQKKILVGIIIVVAVALIAIGGVFAYQYFSKSQNSNTQTAGWKTYTNTQYGFEVKYPQNFKVTTDIVPVDIFTLYMGYNNTYLGDISMRIEKNNKTETAIQYFTRERDIAQSHVNECQKPCESTAECQACSGVDINAELYNCLLNNPDIIKIGGKDGFLCKNAEKISGAPIYNSIYIFNGSYIYTFINYQKSNPTYNIYKEILSTFKFTK